jgi:hypothetical protein
VGGSYLQVVAAAARVESARAQLETARAGFTQATRQNEAGVNARIDVDRSQVELQSQRLRLISLETDLASQKLAFGRLIGLPLGQDLTLTTTMEYTPNPELSLTRALVTAFASRADLQAAEARSARLGRRERRRGLVFPRRGERQLGRCRENPGQATGVFRCSLPSTFRSDQRTHLGKRRVGRSRAAARGGEERGRVDVEVRTAFFAWSPPTNKSRTAIAHWRARCARRDRLPRRRGHGGGVQAQETVASAELDYISSLYCTICQTRPGAIDRR